MNAHAVVLGPADGRAVKFRGLGVRFMVEGEQSGGGFALVEHPIDPRSLASPMHTHKHEDEYTFVLEGEVGVQVGDEVHLAKPGGLVFKPRGIPHAFWNPGDTVARALEIISPAGFEKYFEELAPLLNTGGAPDYQAMAALWEKYDLDMDPESAPVLVERYGLTARA